MSQSNNNIYPKDCSYGCGLQIYWNTAENTFFEVRTQKKHICPNSSRKPNTSTGTSTTQATSTYYNKKPWLPKPKMSNSFELLEGKSSVVQQQYEVLSDIITEFEGKIHGSQMDNQDIEDEKEQWLVLMVYYEVPEGKRNEVKKRFEFSKNKPAVSNFTI